MGPLKLVNYFILNIHKDNSAGFLYVGEKKQKILYFSVKVI